MAAGGPRVSVVVANHNGARHLGDALASILGQTLADIEVLLADDASTDGSQALAARLAATDPRLRLLPVPQRAGPAAARNRALAAARADWIAIVDGDDLLHPDRLRRLVAAAERDGADIVADDLLAFPEAGSAPARWLFRDRLRDGPAWIDAAAFIDANHLFGRAGAPLGYLKPLLRTATLSSASVRYDETLWNGEDYDLLLRLLLRGARLRLLPEPTYFYRRHAASLSHRLPPGAAAALLQADTRLRAWAGAAITADLARRLDARRQSLIRAAALEATVAALKAHRPVEALRIAGRTAAVLPLLARAVAGGRIARWLTAGQRRAPARPGIIVLSRQRLVAGATGSADYLLGLCRRLKAEGFALHLVQPSPGVFGRQPWLDLRGAAAIFDSIALRGAWRLGGVFLARDPRVALRAGLGVLDGALRRLRLGGLGRWAQPAPYAVAAPWTPADAAFVAGAARGRATAVLADYAFATPGIPYVLQPRLRSAVVMHDLFAARPAAFAAIGAADSVAAPTLPEEARLLGAADAVLAIQADEAAALCPLLPPDHPVLLLPMTATPVAAPQPGEGRGLLFVGSATAPNIDGLRWFLTAVFPLIRAARPGTALRVAGTVGRAFGGAALPAGVTLLGRVGDLTPVYRAADVVVSPLRAGSGLKIKLVEALAQGKAMVATSVTAQGVQTEVAGALRIADTPGAMAAEVLHLLADPAARAALAAAALAAARRHFAATGPTGIGALLGITPTRTVLPRPATPPIPVAEGSPT